MVPLLERHVDGNDGKQSATEDDQHPEKQLQRIDNTAGKSLHGEVEQVIELAG